MTKCEVIDLVALIAISSKRHAISVHTASVSVSSFCTSSSCYNGNYRTRACSRDSRSQAADSFALLEAGSFGSRC